MALGRFEAMHVATGRRLLKVLDDPDLSSNVPLWRALWSKYRDEILPAFVRENPGRRPEAWHEFEAPEPWPEDESEVDYLWRVGVIEPAELDGIHRMVLSLLPHLDDLLTETYGDLVAFARSQRLLKPERTKHEQAATRKPRTAGTRG
jgi:hypothetical protein